MNSAESDYVYVRDRDSMEKLIVRIGAAARGAFDTEADSLDNYFEKVCLIQLSVAGENYIVDPLAELDLTRFGEALAEKPLIVHGGDYDLRMMRASMGFKPGREVFDTMIAAQLLGFEQIGLAALIERFLGVAIEKTGQKSDWSRRPLSEKQLRYAINDTRFLEEIADRVHAALREVGRVDWHWESCQAMVQSTGRVNARDPEAAWRIKGSGRFSRRQLAYLREIWRWRDQQARHANAPAFKILGNQQIFEMALWTESHPAASLQQGPKLPRNLVGWRLSTLEEAIRRAEAMAPAQWPELLRHDRDPSLSGPCKEQVTAMRAECARIPKELNIAASTLAPRAAIEAIARSQSPDLDENIKKNGLLRWEGQWLQGVVDKILASK